MRAVVGIALNEPADAIFGINFAFAHICDEMAMLLDALAGRPERGLIANDDGSRLVWSSMADVDQI